MKLEHLERLREGKGDPKLFGRLVAAAVSTGLAAGQVRQDKPSALPETQVEDTQETLATCGTQAAQRMYDRYVSWLKTCLRAGADADR